ncbi:hypothetical protein HQQ80_02325 [Microbacteriaceae bacterium VKM Ac-2855]|nr:hypothetical protein [Microbacteriaceae bacterium VKM Ac-2855]
MNSLRDLGYDRLVVGYFVGPLVGVTADDVRRAVRDVLASPRGGALLRVRTRGGRWRSVGADAALERAVTVVSGDGSDGLGLERAAKRILEVQFVPGDLPIRIMLDEGVLAFAMPHALFDGTGATVIVGLVVEKLASPGRDDIAAKPATVKPLRTAMQKFSLTGLAGIRTARATFRSLTASTDTGYQLGSTLSKTESVRRTRLVSTILDEGTLRRIAAIPEQAADGKRPARPPVSLKAASLVLRTLRDCATEGLDFRVVVPIDARRWAEKGTDVAGNFSPSVPMGTLRGDDWSATSLLGHISSATKSGLPITWLLAGALVTLKNTVRHLLAGRRPPRETPRIPFEIHLSLPSFEAAVPESLMPEIGPASIVGGIPGHLDFPLGVWVEVAPMRDTMHVTVWDETGTFDLAAFEARLHTAIDTASSSARA